MDEKSSAERPGSARHESNLETLLARSFWLHPLLVPVAPALSGLRLSKDTIGASDSLPFLLLLGLWGGFLLLAFAGVYRNWHLGGLAASFLSTSVLLTSYLPDQWWPIAWMAVPICLALALLWRRVRIHWPTALANTFALCWIALGVAQCIQDSQTVGDNPQVLDPIRSLGRPDLVEHGRPDIFVLVLDSYGRADTLEANLQFRPQLAEVLRDKGFMIGHGAVAPHAQTDLTLAAVLGLDNLDRLLTTNAPTKNRRPLRRLIDDGAALRLLREAGYKIVSIPGDYASSRLPSADETLFAGCILNSYDYHFISRSLLPYLLPQFGLSPHALSDAHRRSCISGQLVQFANAVPQGGPPTFVFAHVTAPHASFVFNGDGSPRPSTKGTLWNIRRPDYAAGYREQTTWLDGEVAARIDQILSNTSRPSIILIFGDHGPGVKAWRANLPPAEILSRMAILTAVYSPEPYRLSINPSTGPVNIMRAIVSTVTGAELPPVDERPLFSVRSHPYEFLDVSEYVGPRS